MDLREQIRIAIGGALAAQEGGDGAADAVMEVLAKQEPVAWTTKLALEYGASTLGFRISSVNIWGEKGVPLYTLPGAQNVPSVPCGWIQRGMAELAAIRNRLDDDTLLDDRTLIERIGKAMLAAAPEAKP